MNVWPSTFKDVISILYYPCLSMSENGAIENIPGGVVRLSKVGVHSGLLIEEAVCVI